MPSHQVLGVFALEVNEILQATPPKLRRDVGMWGNAQTTKIAKTKKLRTCSNGSQATMHS